MSAPRRRHHGDDFADWQHHRGLDNRNSARAPQLGRAEGPRPGGGGALDVGRDAAAQRPTQRPRVGSIEWLDSRQEERHESLYVDITAAVRYGFQQLGGKVEALVARDNRVRELEHQVRKLEHQVEERNNKVQQLEHQVLHAHFQLAPHISGSKCDRTRK